MERVKKCQMCRQEKTLQKFGGCKTCNECRRNLSVRRREIRKERRDAGWFIYALVDPNTNQFVYVGRSYYPKRRYAQHLNPNQAVSKSFKEWIIKLHKGDLKPPMVILEKVDESESENREMFWIQTLIAAGNELMNVRR